MAANVLIYNIAYIISVNLLVCYVSVNIDNLFVDLQWSRS